MMRSLSDSAALALSPEILPLRSFVPDVFVGLDDDDDFDQDDEEEEEEEEDDDEEDEYDDDEGDEDDDWPQGDDWEDSLRPDLLVTC